METAQVMLITNAGQGFGRSVARAFGKLGGDVVCADRDGDLASKTAAEIEEVGGQAIPIQADMTTRVDILDAFAKVTEIFGELGGFVHVASYHSTTPFERLGEAEFNDLFGETLKSCYLSLQIASRMLEEGSVVLISPPSEGEEPQMLALRRGLGGLTEGMARRQSGLRVNVVIPSRPASDPEHDALLVDTVIFLSSSAAAGIDGQEVDVQLPPPPKASDTLLPEVQAALDTSIRQDDLEAGLLDQDDAESEDTEAVSALDPGTPVPD